MAEESKAREEAGGRHSSPIVTAIAPADRYYAAEDYHQDYYDNNRAAPYCRVIISPKLAKLGMN